MIDPPQGNATREGTRQGWAGFAREVHLTLENPEHSTLAWLISNVVLSLIIATTGIFVMESYPTQQTEIVAADHGSGSHPSVEEGFDTLEFIEMVAVYIFSVEYLLRLCFHHGSRVGFVFNTFNLIDLCAIIPWYLEYSFGHKGLDALRVLRVLRLFRLLRHSPDLKMFMTCLGRSLESFKLLGLFGAFAVLIFSSLLWYAEKGVYDDTSGAFLRSDSSESPFGSIPSAFWWSIVTMTTVGYGDTYPVEPAGKFVAAIAMISGILVLALPLTIIGTNFSAVYEERKIALALAALGTDAQGAILARAATKLEAAAAAVDAAMQTAIAVYSVEAGSESAMLTRLCKVQLEAAASTNNANLEAIMGMLRSPEFAAGLPAREHAVDDKEATAKDEAASLIQHSAAGYLKARQQTPEQLLHSA